MMLKWLTRGRNKSRHRTRPPRNGVRLAFEALESRYCPSGPQITAFNASAVQGQGETVLLTGTVSDPGASSVSVSFQGVASGTATVSNGSFSLETSASSLGNIYAEAVDNLNLSSAQVQTQVRAAAPNITENLVQNSGTSVTLSGMVTSGSPGGLTVTFSGEVSGSTTTDANGNYSFTANAAGLGTISAQTMDVWGQASNSAAVMLSDSGPTISFSVAQAGGHNVTITGQVNAQSPGGLTVTFSGVASGTATTSSTGGFSYSGTASSLGQITAQVTDVWGVTASYSAQVADTAPTIQGFAASYNQASDTWTFSGQVSAAYVAGLTVTLSNIPGEGTVTITTNSQGVFSYVIELPAGTTGTVTATVTDSWGETSQPVTAVMSA
jgi:hypothetical protein